MRKKSEKELLGAFSTILPAHLRFLNIKKAKFDDIVALLAHVIIPDEVTVYNTISTQAEQQQDCDYEKILNSFQEFVLQSAHTALFRLYAQCFLTLF